MNGSHMEAKKMREKAIYRGPDSQMRTRKAHLDYLAECSDLWKREPKGEEQAKRVDAKWQQIEAGLDDVSLRDSYPEDGSGLKDERCNSPWALERCLRNLYHKGPCRGN